MLALRAPQFIKVVSGSGGCRKKAGSGVGGGAVGVNCKYELPSRWNLNKRMERIVGSGFFVQSSWCDILFFSSAISLLLLCIHLSLSGDQELVALPIEIIPKLKSKFKLLANELFSIFCYKRGTNGIRFMEYK